MLKTPVLERTVGLDATSSSGVKVIAIAAFLLLCGFFVLLKIDTLFYGGPDLAHHAALVTRLMEHLDLQARSTDPSLGEMQVYPACAHVLAATIGTIVNSPILAMHIVVLTVLLVAWSAWALAAGTLPRPAALATILFMAFLFLLNDAFIHLEVLGQEVVGHFFYAQLVAGAMACVALAGVTWLDADYRPAWQQYAFLAVAALLLSRTHLLAALQQATVT